MSTIALVVEKDQEEVLRAFLPTVKEAELELGLALKMLIVSDGPARLGLEDLLLKAGLAGRVLDPPAWGEVIGLEASEARLVSQVKLTEAVLLRLTGLPPKATLAETIRRSQMETAIPEDWDSSHRALPPRLSGFSRGLIHCAACQVLLRSERGNAPAVKPRTYCPGKPG